MLVGEIVEHSGRTYLGLDLLEIQVLHLRKCEEYAPPICIRVLPCQRIVEKHEPSKLFKPAEVAHLIPAGYPVSGEDERLKVGHARFQVCRDPRDPILVQIERPQPRKQLEAPEFNDLVV